MCVELVVGIVRWLVVWFVILDVEVLMGVDGAAGIVFIVFVVVVMVFYGYECSGKVREEFCFGTF